MGALASLQKQKDKAMLQVQSQQKLQWEHGRLAEQAREVVKRREDIESSRVECDVQVRKLKEQMMETAQKMQVDTAKLRQCQTMQAENSQLQEKANECRAAAQSSLDTVGAPMAAAYS